MVSYATNQAVGVVLRIHSGNIRSTHEEALRDPIVKKNRNYRSNRTAARDNFRKSRIQPPYVLHQQKKTVR